MITLSLWPPFIDELNAYEGKAITFQNLTLKDYNNKVYLDTSVNTIIIKEGTEEAVERLNDWFNEKGCDKMYEELQVP